MAVVTLPEPYRYAGAMQWPGGMPRPFRALVLALVCTALALLVVALRNGGTVAPQAPTPAAAVPHSWVDVAGPVASFALDSPIFGKVPLLYTAQRQVPGGGRRDRLAFGQFDGGATPYLQISLYRIGSDTPPAASFFVELARRAAETALAVTRSDQPAPLATRFGDFEVADIALARGAVQSSCLGFRFHDEKPGFQVAGFACGAAGKPIERAALACTLDRLRFVAAGADHDLGLFFAADDPARRWACGDGHILMHSATAGRGGSEKHGMREKDSASIQRTGRKPNGE